jgi:hypothetical protein
MIMFDSSVFSDINQSVTPDRSDRGVSIIVSCQYIFIRDWPEKKNEPSEQIEYHPLLEVATELLNEHDHLRRCLSSIIDFDRCLQIRQEDINVLYAN